MPRLFDFEGKQFEFPDDFSDEEALSFIDKQTKPPTWGKVYSAIPGAIKRGFAGVTAGIDQAVGDTLGVASMKERAQLARQGMEEEAKLDTPPNMTIPQEAVVSGVSSAATLLPAAALTTVAAPLAASATPIAAGAGILTSVMGGQTALRRYSELRDDDKFSPGRAGLHAAFEGLVEKYTEYLPAKELFKNNVLTKEFSKYFTKEVGGELAATTLQDLSAKLSDRPDMTIGDYARDLAVTALATPIGGTVQYGAFKAAGALMPSAGPDERTLPESKDTLLEQQKALVEGRRSVQMFPTGTEELPAPPGIERLETPRGIFHFNPNLITAKTIETASAAGQENQVLGLGPLSKTDIAASGQPAVAVVEKTPEGTEVLTAATTLDRLQETLDALKAQAAKGNTVTVEDPQDIVLSRMQKGGDQAAANAPTVAPPATSVAAVAQSQQPVTPSVEAPPTSVPAKAEAAVETKPTELTIRRGTQGTVSVLFPNRPLKDLFRLGNMLEQRDHSTNPPKPEFIEHARKGLAQRLGISETRVEERAQIYHEAVRKLIKSSPANSQVIAMTETQARHQYVLNTYSPPNDLKRGVVALRDGLQPTEMLKTAQAYLQRWVNGFIPDAKVVIIGETTAGASASVTYFRGVHYVAVPKEFQRGENITQWKAKWLFYLAHEFGHIIFNERIHAAENEQYAAKLRQEHAELVARVSTMTVAEFAEAWYGPATTMRLKQAKSLYGIDPHDPAWLLVAEIDRLHGNRGYTLSFEEWMAEQFTRHVNKEITLKDSSFWQEIYVKLKDFFDRVVHYLAPTETYKEFVNSLRTAPQIEDGIEDAPPSTNEAAVEDARIKEEFQYTFRVLSRLPNKPMVKKATIMAETARQDVRGQESRLIIDTLSEMPGVAVDMQIFKQKLLNQIVPLRTDITEQFANYGLAGLGLSGVPYAGQSASELSVELYPERKSNDTRLQVIPYTRIYSAPFETGGSGHFRDYPEYYAHVRGYNFRDEDAGNVRVLVEVQSDRAQHDSNNKTSPEELPHLHKDLRVLDVLEKKIEAVKEVFNKDFETPVSLLNTLRAWSASFWEFRKNETGPFPTIPGGYYYESAGLASQLSSMLEGQADRFQRLIEESAPEDLSERTFSAKVFALDSLDEGISEVRLARGELNNQLTEGKNLDALPKNWEQLILLSEMQKASKEGAQVMWIPGDDETVAKIEGYDVGRTLTYGQAKALFSTDQILEEYTPSKQWPTDISNETLVNFVETDGLSDEPGIIFPDDLGGVALRNITPLQRTEVNKFPAKVVSKEYTPILRRYRDMAKWAQKALGGKVIENNNYHRYYSAGLHDNISKWVEIPLKPELADMPITYYAVGQALDEQIEEATPELTKVEATLPKAVKSMGVAFTTMLQLNQMAKLWPGLHGLQTYRRAMQALHALKSKLFEGPNEQLREWYKLPTKQGELVEDALRAEVDAQGHWTELVKDPTTGQWLHTPGEAMKRILTTRGLSRQAQELFVKVKNDFLLTLQTMEAVLREHVDNFFKDSPLVLAQRHAELDTMFQELREKPYLPDSRFGQWSVQVRAKVATIFEGSEIKKNELLYWQKFDSKRERDRALAEVKKMYGKSYTVSGSYDPDIIQPLAGMPGGFVSAVIEDMNQNESTRLTPEQMEALQELAFYQTRAGRFARYLRMPKKMTGGASTDIRRVYAAYHWKAANAIAKMKFSRALRNSIRAVGSASMTVRRNGGTSDEIDRMHRYLNENYEHVMHPTNDYPRFRAFVSMWYLFGSVKTALMNLSSVPILAFPYISARHGEIAATTSLVKAMKTVVQYWRDPSKVSPDIQRVLNKAREDGVTDQSFAAILASVSDGGVAFEKMMPRYGFFGNRYVSDSVRKATWRTMSMGMAPFRAIEQLNRQVTLLAMYELEAAKFGKTLSNGDTTAYDSARDSVDYTQNEYAAWNQPKFMWGGKAPFFLFYSFVQNMSFLMFGGDKSWWRAMMMLAAMGGLLALPGAENMIDMLNFAWRKWSGQHEDLRKEAREVFEAIGMNPDLVLHGMSHNLFGLGWDVSSSIGQGRVIPGTDAIFGIGKFEQRFVNAVGEVGGPAGGMTIAFLQALADDNPNTLLRFSNTLPAMFKNIAKAANMVETGEIQDRQGRAVVQDPTVLETIGQAAGFRPTRAAESSEMHRLQRDAMEFYAERRSNLMEMYYAAQKAGNSDALDDVKDAIQKYNASVPVPVLSVTAKDLANSLKVRAKQETAFESGNSPQKKYQLLFQLLAETYND